VSGEANEADLALLFCRKQRFGLAIRRENQIRIVVIDHLVNLPEIEMIGLQAA
jgi:hypothetical protein